ncbi:MAG: Holliday junction resolvase RuvX [Candidatus Gastranaerophilales bacterium]|nr:Holliday junction resolvase RuvX [Candidatus Gastranaerophilales bacterium]
MHKIMCLDVGTKRIGVALSDYLHITVNGYGCVDRMPENKAVDDIIKIAKENNVKTIVVGVPVNMDGTYGFQSEDCIKFAGNFNGFDIIFEDERLTSDLAEENLGAKKIDFRKNKSLVDIESACIILEQYLSRK